MKRIAAFLMCVAFLFAAGVASAAPANPAAVTNAALDVQLWPAEPEGQLVIVSATLPTATPLPAVVRLPLPEGAEVFWAGEITGLGANMDQKRDFKVVDGTGGQAVEVVAKEYRQIQYEADYGPPAVNGANLTSTLRWVQSVPSASQQFAVDLDASASVVAIKPAPVGDPDQNELGDSLFILPPQQLDVGAPYTLTVEYTTAPAAGEAAAAASNTTVIVILGVLVALLVVVLVTVIVLSAHRRRGETGEDGY